MARRNSIAELEGALVGVGAVLDFPDALDLAPAVMARLEREPVPARRPLFRLPRLRLPVFGPPPVLRPAWQAVAAAVVAFAVVVSGVLVASPGARDAVAGWLGLRGVRIVQTPAPTTPPPTRTLGNGLDLGRRTTLAVAEDHLGTRILLPAGLGSPDEVYVRDLSLTGVQVYLVYGARPGLPKTGATGVGLLLGEFTGDISTEGMIKFTEGARLEFVQVGQTRGYWIEHGHAVGYVDSKGNVVGDTIRLAGNVLLWEQGNLTLRIESALSKAQAVALARTIR